MLRCWHAENKIAIAVEIGTDLAGEFLDAGRSGVLDDVLDAERGSGSRVEGRGARVGSRGARKSTRRWTLVCRLVCDLVSDGGHAQAEPVELVVARSDDGEGHAEVEGRGLLGNGWQTQQLGRYQRWYAGNNVNRIALGTRGGDRAGILLCRLRSERWHMALPPSVANDT